MQEAAIIKFRINGKEYSLEQSMNIHDFLSRIGIVIPKACHVAGKTNGGRCKVCLVEINDELATSCNNDIKNDMDILTHSHKAIEARAWAINFLISHHPALCHSCHKMGDCRLAEAFMISGKKIEKCFKPSGTHTDIKQISSDIQLDYSKCIYCGQCDDITTINHQTVESCPTGALEKVNGDE
ncbi:MAG: (2Fe-2S)-binding protein [Oligoflexia bacterium]|nr:(2Fe-2S)-binding protein [Oligoflexia bacterium]